MSDSPSVERKDVEVLLKAAGLSPDEAQMGEILDAYSHLQAMLGRLPVDHGFGDEPAHVFVPLKF